MVPVRQHFLRFEPGPSPEACDDARFDVFTRDVFAKKIAPLVERDVRTIIFVPSYFDYVRLRNYMIREHRDAFAAICEYTSLQQQRKALGQFTDLERPLLLVTERFYFFKRYFVKLAEVMVFYSPPVFPAFYMSLVSRLVANSPNAFALTLFCRFDTHELNRIVGTRRTRQLLEREADAYSFVTN
ncbi:U3 small nucleolar RNA-associated protein 25 [Trypanosoma grayi]|uniref:U3 small nucleolar RNA-associated protein 25 n=1 Tax=Trypanosoma grayi TaxID=71804 RepID=UPI0004F4221B|nr:U3 small nucleolar RNA-associated protein 25 [Trypanosoma grayi]KEG09950.1 U3 small nucleolar RNA-associated protein 25 [Trypanosoma grayi]